jgi:hypothetical protein
MVRARAHPRPLELLLAAMLPLPGLAAGDAASDATSVYAGIEVGTHDTRRLDAGGTYQRGALQLSAAVANANVELPSGATESTLAVARASFDFGNFGQFGHFGVSGGYRHGEVEDVARNGGWFAGAFLDREGLRVGVEVEARHTKLEPTPFTEDLGGSTGIVSGISRCELDSLGYEARADLDRPSWAAYASIKVYDYSEYDCALDLDVVGAPPGGGPPPHARGRALGRRLAAAALQPAEGFASRLVPRESVLLDSTASVGVTVPLDGRWIGGAELYRDEERIGGATSATALVFANVRLDARWSAEVTLGYSAADEIDDTAFAGVRVTADL